MLTIEINKYLTLAIAVGVLELGQFLRKRIRFLETFCIPAPVVGGLVGRMLNLDGRVKRSTQQATEGSDFPLMQGLTTAVLLFCIGTLSIVGPINSALLDDNTFLFTNATLDLVTSAVLAATYGWGIALAAPILFCWQGSIYLIAKLCGNVISDELLCEMSTVGGTLIAASGLSILEIKDCKTLNLLPALFVPVVFFLIKGLWE